MSQSKIKIVIITSFYLPHYGGAEFQIDNFASGLAKLGHEVTVLTVKIRGTQKEEIYNGYKIIRFGNGYSKSGKQQSYREILEFLKKNYKEFNICYLSFSGSNRNMVAIQFKILNLLRLNNVRRIIRITSSDRITEAVGYYPNFVEEIKQVDYFITLNNGIEKELLNLNVEKNKILKINNGVDDKLFMPISQAAKFRLRKMNNFNTSDTIFIYAGRLAKKKNVPLLITSWYKYKFNENENFKLLILANDNFGVEGREEKDKVNLLIKKYNIKNIRIINTDSRKKVADFYKMSDVCLNFSSKEGMCNSLLEGMSVGLRIMCSNIVANKQIVENNTNGFIFNLKNQATIKNAFRLSLPKNKKMSEVNIKKIQKSYSMTHNFQILLKLIKDLLK